MILFQSPAQDSSARAWAKKFYATKRASELLQMSVIMSRTFGWCFSSHKQCRVLHCRGPASETLLKCKLVFKTDTDSNESFHLNSVLTPREAPGWTSPFCLTQSNLSLLRVEASAPLECTHLIFFKLRSIGKALRHPRCWSIRNAATSIDCKNEERVISRSCERDVCGLLIPAHCPGSNNTCYLLLVIFTCAFCRCVPFDAAARSGNMHVLNLFHSHN